MEIDEWDRRLIRHCKSQGTSLRNLREIWAERCGVEAKPQWDGNIVRRMVKVADEIGLLGPEDLIEGISPSNQWRYGIRIEAEDANDTSDDEIYLRRCLGYLSSVLAHCPVRLIPGWEKESGQPETTTTSTARGGGDEGR